MNESSANIPSMSPDSTQASDVPITVGPNLPCTISLVAILQSYKDIEFYIVVNDHVEDLLFCSPAR